MPVPAATAAELQSSLSKLSIGEKGPIKDVQRPHQPSVYTRSQPKSAPKPKEAVAESWEDEANSSEDEDTDTAGNKEYQGNRGSSGPSPSEVASPSISNPEGPLDPPPTPISPPTATAPSSHQWLGSTSAGGGEYGPSGSGSVPSSSASSSGHRSPASGTGTARRPEKQTAVAGRMIAGALGIRAPKRTPEQRAYDRAVKEQEIKRRDREKEEAAREREDEERAKAAVWDE